MADFDMAEVTPIAVHTLDEAAVILRVKRSWLQRRAAARKIPFTMLGGAYHFTPEHIVEIVRINEKRPAATRESKAVRRKAREQQGNETVTMLRPRPRPDGPRRKRTAA
jgi:excisionase family DNA binding protein